MYIDTLSTALSIYIYMTVMYIIIDNINLYPDEWYS